MTQLKPSYDPTTMSSAAAAMAPRIKKLDCIYGGTETLRKHSEVYLPKYDSETPAKYKMRLDQTILRRNMYRQAVERVTGRIFEVPVKLEDLSKTGEVLQDDADGMGMSLDRFCKNVYSLTLRHGLSCVLVDYPVVRAENAAEERALKPRPILVQLPISSLLRCYTDSSSGQIIHLAWSETSVSWDRDKGEEVRTEIVNERFPGVAVRWTRQGNSNWVKGPEVKMSQPKIMLHLVYAEKLGLMEGRTPLQEVAELTLEHYQVGSDYRNALKYCLFPVLTVIGVPEKEVKNIVLGPDVVLSSANPDAKLGWLEHTGAALDAGFKDLESLEQRAEAYAGRLTKSTGDVKATTEAISTAEVSSFAKDLAVSLQDVMQAVLDDCALWVKEESLGRVKINMDFAVDLPDGDVAALGTMRSNRDLTRQTYWKEMTRRNVLTRDFDADAEDLALEDEDRESLSREQEAMRFSANLKEETGSGSPFPANKGSTAG